MAFDRRETAILLIGDFLIFSASLWVALTLRNLEFPPPSYFQANVVPFIPFFLLSLVIFYVAGLYEKQTRPIRRIMGIRILGAQAATVSIAAILFFILPLSIAPKTILALYLVVSVAAISAWRFYRMQVELADERRIPALLLGSGPAVLELYEEVNTNSKYLIRFGSRIDTANLADGGVTRAIVEAKEAGTRIIVLDTKDAAVLREVAQLYPLLTSGLAFRDFSFFYEEIFDRVPLDHVDSFELVQALPAERALYDTAKRLFDIVLAALAVIVAVPFVGAAALMVGLQGGSPFITNERIGKGGRTFRILKLRSMLFNDHGDPELQKKNRITAFGRFLRKSRIDELPQLWNVLMGDLSFIGPRPELPQIAEVYQKEFPQYSLRHLIPPGLSGWAQIHDADAPKGPADIARTRRKLSFDLYYLKHRSFGLDLAIAVKTLRTLFSFSGK